jgi:pre-rRNA-processing protein TSR1
MPAKERFKKYRGLDSMKTGSWDPLTNLPKEYRTIFSFENIKNTFRLSVKRAHNEGLKLNGNYVKIIVTNFEFENLKYGNEDIPLVLSTLLDHERKLCVMHYKFTANYEQDNTIVENMNKNVFECHCGFRRYLIKPIFSNDIFTGGDKLKIQKYLEKDKFYIMTTYAQLTYPNSPVILFTHKTLDDGKIDEKLSFCGTGLTLESNDKKIILKKIVLTGYPVKIKKKKAIVRYMFFNPSDINYFKPIQLTTKKGLRGNITESVGTHGYMKCIFSDFIKSNDTVCLNLYKRVFPKYFKETWKYKVFNGNREDYLSYFKPREIAPSHPNTVEEEKK